MHQVQINLCSLILSAIHQYPILPLTFAAPGYEITTNVMVQSDDQISVIWVTPDSVQNQSLMYFEVTVESLNDANPFYIERRSLVDVVTINGLGKSSKLAE